MRIHTPTDEAELADILDRIMDQGLSMGPGDTLLAGYTDFSDPRNYVRLVSMRTYFNGWIPLELRTLRPHRVK